MSSKNENKLTFEQMLVRLDEIVRLLERSDTPLEDSLALYEEGTGLLRKCNMLLLTAEQKVIKLQKSEDGSPVELPFEMREE